MMIFHSYVSLPEGIYFFQRPWHRFVECRTCQRTPVLLRQPLLNVLHLIGVAVFRHHRIFEELLGDAAAKFCRILRQTFDLRVQQQNSAELKGGKAPSEGFVQFPYYFSGGWCKSFRSPIFLKCSPGVTSPLVPLWNIRWKWQVTIRLHSSSWLQRLPTAQISKWNTNSTLWYIMTVYSHFK